MRKYILRVCIIGFFYGSLLPYNVSAQSGKFTPLYIFSLNSDTHLSTIWSYDLATGKTAPVFTLQNTKTPARVLYSAQELADMKKAHDEWADPSKAPIENYPPFQTIVNVWRFDVTHLLVQTSNELQATPRGADNNWGAFGYSELLLLDLQEPHGLRSLLKIDYHGRIVEDWHDCVSGVVEINEVVLNPKQDKFAVSVSCSESMTYRSPSARSIVIVDYATSLVTLTRIPMASEAVWSPDGSKLAYLYMTCTDKTCDASIHIYSVQDEKTAIIDSTRIDHIMPLQVFTWVDENALIYQFPRGAIVVGDEASVSKLHQLDSHATTIIESNWSTEMIQLYTLVDSSGSKVLIGYDGSTIVVLSPQEPFKKTYVLDTGERSYLKFNSRYPERILLFLKGHLATQDRTIVLNADLSQVPIDLSLPENQWVLDSIVP